MNDAELTEVFRKYGDMLFRLAYSCTGDMSVCDDIVQEALLRYYRCGKLFDGEEGRKAWLIRVTVNLCRNHTKHWWNKRRVQLTGIEGAPGGGDSDELADLQCAILRLRPIYREVIYLHYYEGYTAEQIGKLLHISTGTVTSRLMRGRAMLKGFLEEE